MMLLAMSSLFPCCYLGLLVSSLFCFLPFYLHGLLVKDLSRFLEGWKSRVCLLCYCLPYCEFVVHAKSKFFMYVFGLQSMDFVYLDLAPGFFLGKTSRIGWSLLRNLSSQLHHGFLSSACL
jgi:hypothetical protein